MKNSTDAYSQPTSGLLLESEPLEAGQHRFNLRTRGDDSRDKDDSLDKTDTGDDDSSDQEDSSDKLDSTDKLDSGDKTDSGDDDGKD